MVPYRAPVQRYLPEFGKYTLDPVRGCLQSGTGEVELKAERPIIPKDESLVMTSIKHPTAIPRVIEASYFREALISRPVRNRPTCEYEKGKAVSQPKRKAL